MRRKFNIAKDAGSGLTTVILIDSYLNSGNPGIREPVMDVLRAATYLSGITPDVWNSMAGHAETKKAAEALFTGKTNIKAAFTQCGLSPLALEAGMDQEKVETAWYRAKRKLSDSEDDLYLSIEKIRIAAAGKPVHLVMISGDPAESHFRRDLTDRSIDALLADNPYSTVSVVSHFQKEWEKKPGPIHPKIKMYTREEFSFIRPTQDLIRTCVKAHRDYTSAHIAAQAQAGFPAAGKIDAPQDVTVRARKMPVNIPG